jgi:carboxymethylenebutenolidase
MTYSKAQSDILKIFKKHIDAELNKDLDTTLSTMTDSPHLNNIPTLVGGIGQEEVRAFYSRLILNDKFFPPDTEMTPVSRTIDAHQLVDEIIFKCTHSHEIGWMLPDIPPTDKRIEIPLVVIVGFDSGKVTHEHIYWDQASVLAQIGLLSPEGLPVLGIETAEKMDSLRHRLKT